MTEGEPSGVDRRFGRYELLELIGRGSLAEVYKAKSFGVEGFEKTIVVRRLLPEFSRNAAFVPRFVEQARLALRLSHANVAHVVDLGRVDTQSGPSYFTAGEYVAGYDLRTLLRRGADRAGGLGLPLSLFVASELAKAFDHAHRRRDEQLRPLGIVHGAPGPGDVLLSWEGEVKLSDFCVAHALFAVQQRQSSPAPRSHKLMYASPEACRGEALTFKSDLFSLGCLLYELIARQHPFQAASVEDSLRALEGARPPALQQRRAGVPPDVANLVERLLQRSPENRPESAARVYEELLALMYTAKARFGAVELSEFLENQRDPVSQPEPLDLESTRVELKREAPRTEPPPPNSAQRRSASERLVSVLCLRFIGSAPVAPSVRNRAKQTLERYGARTVVESAGVLSAVFGLDQADHRDTETAARCALSLVRSLGSAASPPAVGVEAGSVAVGLDEQPLDDGRLRKLTDTASALAVAPGRVLLSDDTAKNLRRIFAVERVEAPVGALCLLSEVRSAHEALGRFVGRKPELRSLGETLARAANREFSVVGVIGEHGIGKTRLVTEMERRVSRGAFDIACYSATLLPRGQEVAYSAIVAMLQGLCGIREGDPPARVAEVEPRLRALGLRDDEVEAVLSELGAPGRGGRAGGAPQLLPAVARMFQSLAEDRLHVFAWDNAQNMDAESTLLLSGLADRLRQSRVVLLFAAHPYEGAAYETIRGYQEIALGPLPDDDVFRLISQRLEVQQLPPELLEFVKQRAGGHPMFIEELLLEAVDSGAVRVEAGKLASLNLSGSLSVPRPLRTLLADRVRRLPEPERQLVLAAAALGASAEQGVLAVMLDLSMTQVAELAESLVRRGLMQHKAAETLAFRTPLLIEVVMAQLSPDRRAELHQAAAQAYQALAGDRIEEASNRVAHHLAEAGDSERAAGFYAMSGLYFSRMRRLDRTARDLSRAIELSELQRRTSAELGQWISALAGAVRHVRVGPRLPELVQRLSQHVEADNAVDARARAKMTMELGQILGALHHYAAARRLLQRAAELGEPWPDFSRLVHGAEAELLNRQGEFKLALAALERAGEGGGDAPTRHRMLISKAQALGGAGRHAEALAAIGAAQRLPGGDDLVLACERAKVRALILGFQGDWRGCAEASELAADQGQAAGLMHEVAVNLHNQGDSLMRLEDHPRAYAALTRSLSVAEEIGSDRMSNLNRIMLAYLDALNGSDAAARVLAECTAIAELSSWNWDVLTGRYLSGVLLQAQGDVAGARRELTLAAQMAEGAGNRLLAEDCERALKSLPA